MGGGKLNGRGSDSLRPNRRRGDSQGVLPGIRDIEQFDHLVLPQAPIYDMSVFGHRNRSTECERVDGCDVHYTIADVSRHQEICSKHLTPMIRRGPRQRRPPSGRAG